MVLREFIKDFEGHIRRIKESYVSVDASQQQEQSDMEQSQKNDDLRKTIYQTFTAPFKIQYYFWLWLFYSFYSFLKLIIFIPFELIIGIINSMLAILHICLSKYITFFSVITLVIGYLFQQEQFMVLDLSYMYHTFRGQSTLKLYGLIFALEVSQKIHTMVGKYLYSRIKEKLQVPTVNIPQLIPEMLACIFYTFSHAFTIYLQFNVYIVVINSSMQNFIIFCFVINLTKMKSTAFKKFDANSYFSQINFDAKDRLQKIMYIALFQLSQFDRSIPDIHTKLIFIFFIGAIIEHIKHITVLVLSGRISEIDNIRNKMFHQMYVSTDDRTFIKCLNNDFTVIPFAIFFIKMVGIILYAHSALSNELIFKSYLFLCFLAVLLKLLIIVIRKINILNSPISEQEAKIESKLSQFKQPLKAEKEEGSRSVKSQKIIN